MSKWYEFSPLSDLSDSQFLVKLIEGVQIAACLVNGKAYAIEDRCTHMDFPLSDGPIHEGKIMCIHHGAEFCIKTGRVLSPPAFEDVSTYETKVEKDILFIQI